MDSMHRCNCKYYVAYLNAKNFRRNKFVVPIASNVKEIASIPGEVNIRKALLLARPNHQARSGYAETVLKLDGYV